MSINQPTVIDKLKETQQRLEDYINLLNFHAHKWSEADHYSAKKTISNLKKQIERIDEIISYVQESTL